MVLCLVFVWFFYHFFMVSTYMAGGEGWAWRVRVQKLLIKALDLFCFASWMFLGLKVHNPITETVTADDLTCLSPTSSTASLKKKKWHYHHSDAWPASLPSSSNQYAFLSPKCIQMHLIECKTPKHFNNSLKSLPPYVSRVTSLLIQLRCFCWCTDSLGR